MFASAATASQPLTIVIVADHVDRDARCGLGVSHRRTRHARRHAGFFVANAVLSRDPLSQGPIGGGSKLPRPRGTRATQKHQKGPPRTLPRVQAAKTDRPGRQTHVPRGAKCRCGKNSDRNLYAGPRQLHVPRSAANHPLNIQRASRPRPTHSTPYARGRVAAAPP